MLPIRFVRGDSASESEESEAAWSSESFEFSLFGGSSPCKMEPQRLEKACKAEAGSFYERAVKSLARSLGVRGGARSLESAYEWMSYLKDMEKGRSTEGRSRATKRRQRKA